MSACCETDRASATRTEPRCPRNGATGPAVDLVTVKALLSESAVRTMRGGPYRFCADPDCPVVYFDTEQNIFTTDDLRVPVWQKQPPGARTICYCFDENEELMARELSATGFCDAAQRVRDHVVAGRCACEVRNPRGNCCLGDVIKTVSRLAAGSRSAPN